MDPKWRQVNLVCSLDGDTVRLEHKPLPKMRGELISLFDRAELGKYLTDEELADLDALVADARAEEER
jgi:succinate dehydrogenase / fumarate reductase flavoprotein subunit